MGGLSFLGSGMPQPLLKVLPGCKTYELDSESVYKHRPDLAVLVSGAIGRWALVEQRIGWLLVRILGADAKPALEMFLAITQVAQIDALKAAARSVLQGETLEFFEAVMKVISSQAKNRNKLVHWLWGYTPELEDALLIANPVEVLRNTIEQERYNSDPHKWFAETGHSEQQLEQILGFDNAIYVYRKTDLDHLIRDFDEVSEIAFLFGRMIAATDNQVRDVLHQQLSKKRLFGEALSRLRADQKNNPKSHP